MEDDDDSHGTHSSGSDEHTTFSEESVLTTIMIEGKEDFVQQIFTLLQSRFHFEVYDAYGHRFDELYSFLETVEENEQMAFFWMLVEGGHIPLPPNGELDEDVYFQILIYLEKELDAQHWREHHFRKLYLCEIGIQYNLPESEGGTDTDDLSGLGVFYQHIRDPIECQLPCFTMHESIKEMKLLEELVLASQCTTLPREIALLTSLKKLTISVCNEIEEEANPNPHTKPVGSHESITMTALEKITIEPEDPESTLSMGFVSWLSATNFLALKWLEMLIDVGTEQTSPAILSAFEANPTLCQIQTLSVLTYPWPWGSGTDELIQQAADFVLGVLPGVLQKCPMLAICLNESGEYLNTFVKEVLHRLLQGTYDKHLWTTLCSNLECLSFSFCSDRSPTHEEKLDMLKLLLCFKRLSCIPACFIDYESPNAVDFEIEHLLRMNYAGGRVLIPATFCTNNPHSLLIDTGTTLPKDDVPLSLWPYILERTDKDQVKFFYYSGIGSDTAERMENEQHLLSKDCTAIYRMLRPNSNLLGPALQGVLSSTDPDCSVQL